MRSALFAIVLAVFAAVPAASAFNLKSAPDGVDAEYNIKAGETEVIFVCSGVDCRWSDAFRHSRPELPSAAWICGQAQTAPPQQAVADIIRTPGKGTVSIAGIKTIHNRGCGLIEGREVMYTAPAEPGTYQITVFGYNTRVIRVVVN